MDEELKEALRQLEYLHAAVWCHFDPEFNRGDKDQPPEIKKALTDARKYARQHGYDFSGWGRQAP